MALEVEAVYENGVLEFDQPLPLAEHQRVRVSVEVKASRVKQSYGLMGWTGDPAVLRQIALDPAFGIAEAL